MLKKAIFAAALALGFTLSFGARTTSEAVEDLKVDLVPSAFADCDPYEWCDDGPR